LSQPDEEPTVEAPPPDEAGVPVAPPPPAAVDESTVGTGSVFAIGCSILALLFVCVGVGIFMWRQVH
jgi:hypothetical protein